MTIRTGPCANWAQLTDMEICPGCSPEAEIDDTVRSVALTSASEILYQLSGRQFAGVCEATVRPCRRCSGTSFGWWNGADYVPGWNGSWGWCNCGNATTCSCPSLQEIELGSQTVRAITSVKVDGVTLNAADYRLDENNFLVRLDGDPWPSCQDLSLADTEDSTWSVTYTYGVDPPTSGVNAAARLACELAKSYAGTKNKLPERIQTITRQDISMSFIDPFDFMSLGKTGIYECDLFLEAYAPGNRRRQAKFASPDVGQKVRRA